MKMSDDYKKKSDCARLETSNTAPIVAHLLLSENWKWKLFTHFKPTWGLSTLQQWHLLVLSFFSMPSPSAPICVLQNWKHAGDDSGVALPTARLNN